MADGLLNKASIILTPTGYKAGTLYNVAPIDEPYEDFDFARTSTATRINSSGLVSNVATGVPRINYDSNGENGHILLEPTSTNLLPYSEDFSQWTAGGDTVIYPNYTAPDGTNSAFKVSGSDNALVYNASATSTQTRTIWAKTVSGTGQAHLCSFNGNTNNLKTITNEWQRFEVNGTTTSSGEINFYAIDFRGSTDLTEIILWGAQLEALSYATSYIPSLTGSTVTRATETLNGSGNSTLINSTEGVLYAEIAALADDATNRCIALSDGTTDDRVNILFGDSSNKIRAIVKSNGSTSFDEQYTVTSILDYHKVAIKYKANDFALWIDGVERFTDTSGSAPIGLNELMFDVGGGTLPFYGKCKALAVFNEALSDSELTQLTT